MKHNLTLLLGIFSIAITFGQIVSSEDSTYSAIAYWSKLDTMMYDVEFKKYKVDKGDTTFQKQTHSHNANQIQTSHSLNLRQRRYRLPT